MKTVRYEDAADEELIDEIVRYELGPERCALHRVEREHRLNELLRKIHHRSVLGIDIVFLERIVAIGECLRFSISSRRSKPFFGRANRSALKWFDHVMEDSCSS